MSNQTIQLEPSTILSNTALVVFPIFFFLFNICWASQLLQDDLRGWIRIGSQVLSKGSLRSLKIQLLNFDAVSEKAIGRKVRGKGGLCVKVAKYRQVPRVNGVKRM